MITKFIPTGILAIAFILAFFGLEGQNVTLNFINASPDGADVLLSWEIQDEQGVTDFKIFRKIDEESNFKYIDQVSPKGTLTYQYLDYTIFKETPKNLTYKLQVFKDGGVYSFYTTIVHNPTSVQRTWGSIKSMFR